jgi:hypothetical protein
MALGGEDAKLIYRHIELAQDLAQRIDADPDIHAN